MEESAVAVQAAPKPAEKEEPKPYTVSDVLTEVNRSQGGGGHDNPYSEL